MTAYNRYLNRRRGQPANERTLISALLPAGALHTNTALSVTFLEGQDALLLTGCAQSILFDFLVKVGGRGDIYESTLVTFPLADRRWSGILWRTARLNCLTQHYADLWQTCFDPAIRDDGFTRAIPTADCSPSPAASHPSASSTGPEGLAAEAPSPANPPAGTLRWDALTPHWQRGCALRTDLERRQALLEIDVLVAMALGLSVEELIQIYEVQFPVMRAYEQADRYDATGRRLPNTGRKEAGARELREALREHDGESPVSVSWAIDNGLQTRARTFYPPFTPVDRVDDYRTAYRVFAARLADRQVTPESVTDG